MSERERERNTERNTNINNKESDIRYLRRHVSERRSSVDLFREECDLRTCEMICLTPGVYRAKLGQIKNAI